MIGSAMMIPIYCRMGVRNRAMSTLPASSMKLDMTGVIWSPMACRAFLKILIPQATKYSREFIRRYLDAFSMTAGLLLPVTRWIRKGAAV